MNWGERRAEQFPHLGNNTSTPALRRQLISFTTSAHRLISKCYTLTDSNKQYLNIHLCQIRQSFHLINLIIFIVPDKTSYQCDKNVLRVNVL